MPASPGDRHNSRSDDATLPPSNAGNIPADATVPAAPDVPRELLNHPRYRVLKLLGEGGMGAVYLAEHLVMGRRVALKTIGAQFLANREAVGRFHREVRAAAKLVHPNIVTAFDADQAGGLHFLVMEYVDGFSVAEYARRKGPLPVDLACSIVSQAALGLQHAHEQGLIHRDVKPANLMLTRKGQVKVLDFGLAQFTRQEDARADAARTASGAVMGTADYIAPEQTSSSRKVDIRADVYSLGCTLYHLLAGRVPFPEGTVIDKFIHHATDTPTPLASLRPGLPAGLVDVVEKLMAKRPEDRYQTPAEVVKALRPFTVPGAAAPAAPAAARAAADDKTEPFGKGLSLKGAAKPAPDGKRRRRVIVAAGAGLFALGGLIAIFLLLGKSGGAPATMKPVMAAGSTFKQRDEEKASAFSVAWSGTGPTHSLVAPEHTIAGSILDFKEIEGATLKEFRDWQAALGPDFRPAYISNRAGIGPALFNGVAVHDRVPVPARVYLDMSDDEGDKNRGNKEVEGLHLMQHSAYGLEGKFRHSQLWAPGGGYEWYGSLENIQNTITADRNSQRPCGLDWAAAGGDQLFATFGTFEDKAQWEVFYRLTRDEVVSTADEYRRKGWRPDVIAPYFNGERFCFMMVVRPNPEPVDWHLQLDMSLQDYKKASAEEKGRGRFPLQVVSYGDEAAVKYAALWVRYKIVD